MIYRSPLVQSRRSILFTGAGIGGLFSIAATLTFGMIGILQIGVSFAYGCFEGLVISGTGLAIQAIFPGVSIKRGSRMLLDFGMGSAVHALASLAIWLPSGVQTLFLTWIIGLLSMVVGELVCARESAILAREEVALAQEGRTRLPPAACVKFGLSARETEVAELLVARASYQDICNRLFISLPTVKSHVSAIYRKSEVSSRHEFIAAVERLREA